MGNARGGVQDISFTEDAGVADTHKTVDAGTANAKDVELQRLAVPRNTNTSRYVMLYTADGLLQEQHYHRTAFPHAFQLRKRFLLPRGNFIELLHTLSLTRHILHLRVIYRTAPYPTTLY